MRIGRLFCALAMLAGCNQVFGLEPPAERAAVDAPPVTSDALSIDAPTDACVLVIDGNECTYDTCGNPPTPRDSYCNGGADQCDGAGNCVDCTTSGGCGECCVCLDQMCVNA